MRLKLLLPSLVYLLCFASAPAFAHGVHETNAQAGGGQSLARLLDFFVRPVYASASMRIDERAGYRYIDSDGLADHATGDFPNPHNPHAIAAQDYQFRMPLRPKKRRSPQAIGHAAFGVALNGVPFDPATAEYWNNDPSSKWNLDAINGGMNFGLDENRAHVQPNGAYHYHGIPQALMERADQYNKPVLLGYAADGFPVYGPYSYADADDMSSELINLFPSYRVKSGNRQSGPRAKFDGRYTQDYEYVAGLGDLDKCNGREGRTPEYPEGTYYYVITDTWPFIPRCWMGKADKSFQKREVPAPLDSEAGKATRPAPPPRKVRRGIDMRRYGIASGDAQSACAGRQSGSFCNYRTAFGTVNGTCRANGPDLICLEYGR